MKRDTGVINAQQAAEELGAHVETVRRLARRGGIPAFKVGKDWRFRREDLRKWALGHHARNHPFRVLVIDDETAVLRLFQRSLNAGGYSAICVRSGPEGLEVLARDPVHLVLLDLAMPGMDGPTFLEEMRKIRDDLPVIVVTGYPDGALMARAMAHGPLLLLPKPVVPKDILKAVSTVLHGARQELVNEQ